MANRCTTTIEQVGKGLQVAALSLFPKTQLQYSKVFVLLLHSECGSPDGELDSLEQVFANEYGFETEKVLISKEEGHIQLYRKILDFIDTGRKYPEHLKVVYYDGHGMDESFQVVGSDLPDGGYQNPETTKWAGILALLEEASSDSLLLLDCCFLGVRKTRSGKCSTEVIAAKSSVQSSDVEDWSFAKALIHELRALRTEILSGRALQFSSGMLYGRLLQGYRSETSGNRDTQYGLVHAVLVQNQDKTRAIQLRPAQDISPPLIQQATGKSSNPETPIASDSASSTPSAPSALEKIPLLRVEVHVAEKLHRYQLSTDLFNRWLKDIPEVAGNVKVEAVFQLESTLLILTLPLVMRAYLPEHEAIVARELVQSRNLLLASATSNEAAGRESILLASLHETDEPIQHSTKTNSSQENAIHDNCQKDKSDSVASPKDELSPGSPGSTQCQPGADADANANHTVGPVLATSDSSVNNESLNLQYYQELEIGEGDEEVFILLDMNLAELRDLASALEGDQEDIHSGGGIEHLRLLCHIFYRIFLETHATVDIQKSIDNVVEAVASARASGADYAPLLKDLVVLLMKKYQLTRLLDDLNRAILRAEEMVTISTLPSPAQALIMLDLSRMKFMSYQHSHSPDALEEARRIEIEAVTGIEDSGTDTEEVHYLAKYEKTRNRNDLDSAISKLEKDLATQGQNHPTRGIGLSILGTLLSRKFQQRGHIDDLNRAISCGEESVAVTPSEFLARASLLSALAASFRLRYERTSDPKDLEKALGRAQEAVSAAAAPHDCSDKGAILICLAMVLELNFDRTSNLNDLHEAITKGREAVALTPEDNPDRARRLSNLGNFLRKRFERAGDSKDLNEAVIAGKEAVASTVHDNPERLNWLNNLSISLRLSFERTDKLDDLDEAISGGQEALALMSRDHPDRGIILGNLNTFFQTKFERKGDLKDLNEAIRTGEEAVAATPLDYPGRAARLHNLSGSLASRSEETNSHCDLEKAISGADEALAIMPDDHPDKGAIIHNRSGCFFLKFRRTDDLEDLNSAISNGEKAIAAVATDYPDRAGWLSSLCQYLTRRSERTGSPTDSTAAAAKGQEAVASTPHDHPARAGRLSNLATSLQQKYKRTGILSDLNDAITYGETAVSTTPFDHPDVVARSNNLCISLRMRYEQTGDLHDLNNAISKEEKVVVAIPQNHLSRSIALNSLGVSLLRRYQRLGDLDDLNKAIQHEEEAVATVSNDYSDKAGILNNLSISLRNRFERVEDIKDLDEAINRGEEAVAFTPSDHPHRARRLANLGGTFFGRYQSAGDIKDLNQAINKGEDAVNATALDLPDRAGRLLNLSNFLQSRYNRKGDRGDLNKAINRAEEAVYLENAPPRYRINAALGAAEMLMDIHDWEKASSITRIAVSLLLKVSPRSIGQNDQQHMLGEFAGLASLAASAALQAGRGAASAVKLLELGRGVIMGLRFGTRTDITDLRDEHPDLAERFEQLREELDSQEPDSSDMADMPTPMSKRSRHDANAEFDKVVDEIRALKNFANFLMPLEEDELKDAASLGPIVIVNVSKYRCDALLVTSDQICALHLPSLHSSEVREKAMGPITTDLLEWLWESTARPILDKLGFLKAPTGDWPRIWWIATGLMGRLPLHAAGRHYTNSSETVLDRVASSYSPSIRALVYARQNALKKDFADASRKALLVSMCTTPWTAELKPGDLRGAEQEIRHIHHLLSPTTQTEILAQPQTEAVVSRLDSCTIFHFAGHGHSHPVNPSKSCLLLNDWAESPLTVEKLVTLKLHQRSPWLAYLSACSTGESQAEELQDETIHLVSACQLAGFPHVVGSLWEIDDEYSVDVAREVYKTLGSEWNNQAVALGVHNAARILRQATSGVSLGVGYATRDEGDPSIWASYIHVGP